MREKKNYVCFDDLERGTMINCLNEMPAGALVFLAIKNKKIKSKGVLSLYRCHFCDIRKYFKCRYQRPLPKQLITI